MRPLLTQFDQLYHDFAFSALRNLPSGQLGGGHTHTGVHLCSVAELVRGDRRVRCLYSISGRSSETRSNSGNGFTYAVQVADYVEAIHSLRKQQSSSSSSSQFYRTVLLQNNDSDGKTTDANYSHGGSGSGEGVVLVMAAVGNGDMVLVLALPHSAVPYSSPSGHGDDAVISGSSSRSNDGKVILTLTPYLPLGRYRTRHHSCLPTETSLRWFETLRRLDILFPFSSSSCQNGDSGHNDKVATLTLPALVEGMFNDSMRMNGALALPTAAAHAASANDDHMTRNNSTNCINSSSSSTRIMIGKVKEFSRFGAGGGSTSLLGSPPRGGYGNGRMDQYGGGGYGSPIKGGQVYGYNSIGIGGGFRHQGGMAGDIYSNHRSSSSSLVASAAAVDGAGSMNNRQQLKPNPNPSWSDTDRGNDSEEGVILAGSHASTTAQKQESACLAIDVIRIMPSYSSGEDNGYGDWEGDEKGEERDRGAALGMIRTPLASRPSHVTPTRDAEEGKAGDGGGGGGYNYPPEGGGGNHLHREEGKKQDGGDGGEHKSADADADTAVGADGDVTSSFSPVASVPRTVPGLFSYSGVSKESSSNKQKLQSVPIQEINMDRDVFDRSISDGYDDTGGRCVTPRSDAAAVMFGLPMSEALAMRQAQPLAPLRPSQPPSTPSPGLIVVGPHASSDSADSSTSPSSPRPPSNAKSSYSRQGGLGAMRKIG